MYCYNCGTKLEDGFRFCFKCGAEQPFEESSIPEQEDTTWDEDFDKAFDEGTDNGFEEDFDKEFLGGKDFHLPKFEKKESPQIVVVEDDEKVTEGIRSIYIIDFVCRMFQKQNIGFLIYMIMNVLLIAAFMCLAFSLNIIWGIVTSLLIYIGSVAVAISPIGDWLLRTKTGCKKITDPEVINRLAPLFNEVYEKAREKNPNISKDVRLYMSDDPFPNAFATGRRTMNVTRGLLALNDETIKGIMGHEFGHLSHRDTDRLEVIIIANFLIEAITRLTMIGIIIFEVIGKICSAFIGGDNGILAWFFTHVTAWLSMFVVQKFFVLWSHVGLLLTRKADRENEFQADAFSCSLGYAESLIGFFKENFSGSPKGIMAMLYADHPSDADRIAAMTKYMDEHYYVAIPEQE